MSEHVEEEMFFVKLDSAWLLSSQISLFDVGNLSPTASVAGADAKHFLLAVVLFQECESFPFFWVSLKPES